MLLVALPIMFVTGLLSYLAYNPGLPGNDTKGPGDLLTSSCSTGPRTRTGLPVHPGRAFDARGRPRAGGAVFTFATGLLNIQYWYTIPGSFYRLYYYGAWVFTAPRPPGPPAVTADLTPRQGPRTVAAGLGCAVRPLGVVGRGRAAYPVYQAGVLGLANSLMQQRAYLPAALAVAAVSAWRWSRTQKAPVESAGALQRT